MVTRALIVEDSPTMQRILTMALSSDPAIEVVGTAVDAHEARAKVKELNPDVMTLDVELPGMNGIAFLERVMRLRPMPVVMISSHTAAGADASIEALALGAFGCMHKPKIDSQNAFVDICTMVKQAAAAKHTISARHSTVAPVPAKTGVSGLLTQDKKLIAIGASTGGVEALTTLFGSFPADCPPTVVTQHMPESFVPSFAARLDRHCKPKVSVAEELLELQPGNIYIAPGGIGHTSIRNNNVLRTRIKSGTPVKGHMPSVDVLFESVAKEIGPNAVGIILTGMGADGAEGLKMMRDAGATTISQSKESCLVYGMPAAAEKLGACGHVLPLEQISQALFAESKKLEVA